MIRLPIRRMPLVVLVALLAVATACNKKTPTTPDPGGSGGSGGTGSGNTGTVSGKITALDGSTGIGGVTVSPQSSSSPSTQSDSGGNFTLAGLAPGSQNLRAKKGNFEALFTVTVVTGQTVTASGIKLQPIGKLAYVPGSYDSIEHIVGTQLGNALDQLSAGQLGSADTLNKYKMIFLNCGLDDGPSGSSATIQALLAWVRAGGTLYASDWAVVYAKAMLPSDISGIDYGTIEQTITASVTDSALQTFVGRSNVQIKYDLPAWAALTSVSSRARVLIRGSHTLNGGTVNDRPLAIVINEGSGKIVVTTFHDEVGATTDQTAVLRFYVYID